MVLRRLLKDNDEIQFLIATHSPILLAYPDAQILSFDNGAIHEVTYRETSAYQVMARFVAAYEAEGHMYSAKKSPTSSNEWHRHQRAI